MTLKKNRAPLFMPHQALCILSYVNSNFTVQKRLNWVLTYVTLTFYLWPWPFAWASLLSLVVTPENFMMIRWGEHCEKCVTDGWTERSVLRAVWSQLKICDIICTTLLHAICRQRFPTSCNQFKVMRGYDYFNCIIHVWILLSMSHIIKNNWTMQNLLPEC